VFIVPPNEDEQLTATWTLSYAATLASSIRKQGIFLEVRARLPVSARKALKIAGGALKLEMPLSQEMEFKAASQRVSEVVQGITTLPVLPREIEDILSISTTERRRWLEDGRLPSAGARTVALRGRARKVTFHIFDPRVVEEVLDRDLVTEWREEDAAAAAEKRRRAAWKAKRTRSRKSDVTRRRASEAGEVEDPPLQGWEEFAREGLLR
jgi:hypothetical protein